MTATRKLDALTDRRRSPRVENRGVLKAEMLSDAAPLTVHDFNSGGFSVLSAVPFLVGDVQRFRITPRDGQPVILSAAVVHSHRYSRHRHGDEYLTGLTFTDVDDRKQAAIDDLLARLTSGLSFE